MRKILTIGVFCILYVPSHAQDWPSFAGPSNNYLADTLETAITDNSAYITFVWKSESKVPGGRGQAPRYGCQYNTKPAGGSSSLLVTQNKVIATYWEPAGTVYDKSITNRLINEDKCDSVLIMQNVELWKIEGNDVVLCMDATTGKTLWEHRFKGLYRNDHAKLREANNTAVIHNGKVYGYTSIGKRYALNLNTGALIWETEGWPSMVSALNQSMTNEAFTNQAIIGSAMMYADGALFFGHQKTLYAYDTANGSLLWSRGNAIAEQANPVVWNYNGKTRLISANQSGGLWCYEPRTGLVLWSLSGLGGNRSDPVVNGQYMLCYAEGSFNDHSGQKIGLYRISDTGATLLWKHAETTPNNSAPGVIVGNKVYKNIESQSALYCFDAETGAVLAKVSAGNSGRYLMYIDNKIIYETDAQHPSMNGVVQYEAGDTLKRNLGFDFPATNGYEWSMSFPIVKGKMYFKGEDGYVHCYDWSVKPKLFDKISVKQRNIALSASAGFQFSYDVMDEYNVPFNGELSASWRLLGNGSISNTGYYTAPAQAGVIDMIEVTGTADGRTRRDTVTVKVKMNQTITCHTFDSVYKEQTPFNLYCSASSGLPVLIEKVSGPFLLNGDLVTMLGAVGTCRLKLQQPGNDDYFAAPVYQWQFYAANHEPDDALSPVTSIANSLFFSTETPPCYPNPFADVLHIPYHANEITFVNTLGITYKKLPKNGQVQTKDLPQGIYTVLIANKKFTLIKQ